VAGLGHSLEEIELVILTHQHIDHLGLVGIVASRSGAQVAAIEQAVPFVENYSLEASADDEFARELMLRHGIPEDVAAALESVSRAFRAWGARADVTRVLRDGERIELRDRTLEVHFRPGHSPTDTVFLDPERKILIAADHLLKHISSNPLITRPRDGASGRPQALVTYLESLGKAREMDVELVLPGHGEPIPDHRALIDERFALHRRRAEKLYGLIEECPPHRLCAGPRAVGEHRGHAGLLTLSEVLGHTDLLMNENRVREVDEGGVVRFEPTDG